MKYDRFTPIIGRTPPSEYSHPQVLCTLDLKDFRNAFIHTLGLYVVGKTGVEPARPFGQKLLRLPRLPFQPLPHNKHVSPCGQVFLF